MEGAAKDDVEDAEVAHSAIQPGAFSHYFVSQWGGPAGVEPVLDAQAS